MRNLYNIKLFTLFVASIFFFGCEADDPEVDSSPVGLLSGEWWVTYTMGDQDFGGYSRLLTSNSAANTAEELLMTGEFSNIVEGEATSFPYMIKVNSNVGDMTFSASAVDNIGGFDSNITVENGRVLLDGGESFSGVTVDSIYMELSFADPSVVGLEPGNTIIVSGVRRTGFPADDY